jgi:hypothetical protein
MFASLKNNYRVERWYHVLRVASATCRESRCGLFLTTNPPMPRDLARRASGSCQSLPPLYISARQPTSSLTALLTISITPERQTFISVLTIEHSACAHGSIVLAIYTRSSKLRKGSLLLGTVCAANFALHSEQ